MKIAFITTGYFPIPPTKGGAVENLVYALVNENEKERKHCMHIYSVYDDDAKNSSLRYKYTRFKYIKIPKILQKMDSIIYYFASNILKKEKNLSFRYIIQRIYFEYIVSRKINKESYDKIIIENTAASFLALKWKNPEKYKKKVIYHVHNEVGYDFGCEKLINNSQIILGISNFVNHKFKERFPKCKGEYKILKNCVTNDFEGNTKEFFDVREKYQIPQNAFVILFVGRLSEEKGVYELIKAFKRIDNENYRLLVVGGTYYGSNVKSPFEERLKKESESLKEHIIFTGYVNRKNIDAFYKNANLIVLPSMWEEPAGLTIIEAMSSGTPVITTNSGGIPEYIGNNNCIVLEKDKNIITNIAEKIQLVYENEEEYIKMGNNARSYAMRYNVQNYYKDFCEILEEIK